jgi:hypothetical protein
MKNKSSLRERRSGRSTREREQDTALAARSCWQNRFFEWEIAQATVPAAGMEPKTKSGPKLHRQDKENRGQTEVERTRPERRSTAAGKDEPNKDSGSGNQTWGRRNSSEEN